MTVMEEALSSGHRDVLTQGGSGSEAGGECRPGLWLLVELRLQLVVGNEEEELEG